MIAEGKFFFGFLEFIEYYKIIIDGFVIKLIKVCNRVKF